jgi:hypothetical protein
MNSLTQTQIELQKIFEEQFLEIQHLQEEATPIEEAYPLERTIQRTVVAKTIELGKLLLRNEAMTKRLLQIELDIKHFSREHEKHELELEKLLREHQKEKRGFQHYQERYRNIQIRSQQYQERKESLERILEIEIEKKQQRKESISTIQQEVESLEAENKKHGQQISFLEDNIAKLRLLREDNLLSVMNLTNTMRDVSSGKDS